jgi:hypothetical protein
MDEKRKIGKLFPDSYIFFLLCVIFFPDNLQPTVMHSLHNSSSIYIFFFQIKVGQRCRVKRPEGMKLISDKKFFL